jgi:hypothetical protein
MFSRSKIHDALSTLKIIVPNNDMLPSSVSQRTRLIYGTFSLKNTQHLTAFYSLIFTKNIQLQLPLFSLENFKGFGVLLMFKFFSALNKNVVFSLYQFNIFVRNICTLSASEPYQLCAFLLFARLLIGTSARVRTFLF